jgi:hypothetical protein
MQDEAAEGLKAAVTKVLRATWQRCRVHFARIWWSEAALWVGFARLPVSTELGTFGCFSL